MAGGTSGLGSDSLLIGLTGPFGSGCSRVAGALLAKWLGGSPLAKMSDVWPPRGADSQRPKNVIKLSDFVKEEADKRSAPPHKRRFLQCVGNYLRIKYGTKHLAAEALEKAAQVQKDDSAAALGFVFDGIRNPGEIDEFRKYARFFLIAVDAPINTRWERLKNSYQGDQGEFEKDDERDHDQLRRWGQKVQRCVDLADMVVKNYEPLGTVQSKQVLESKLRRFLDLIATPGSYEPTPMEINMNAAYVFSAQSTCLRRQVGAVVCDADDSPVGRGYNEVPNPEKDLPCKMKLGRCYRIEHAPPGKDRAPVADCRAVHAEQRAIIEASRHSHDLTGSTLYTTTFPCDKCAQTIALARISRVVFVEPYPETTVNHVLEKNEIDTVKFEGVKGQSYMKLFIRPSETTHYVAPE